MKLSSGSPARVSDRDYDHDACFKGSTRLFGRFAAADFVDL